MTGRPRHTRKDTNQLEIVHDLQALGCVVWDTANLGGHVLDIIVFWRGQVRIVEIKAPGRITFTDGEIKSMEELELVGIEVVVAQSLEDVLAAFDALEGRPFADVRGELGSMIVPEEETISAGPTP